MQAVAATAIRVNVFHTIDFLLKYSAPLRERVENGDVEIHGGIYHLDSGKVEFMGESPRQAELLNSSEHIPPSMTLEGGRCAGYGPPARGAHGLRTAADGPMSANEALNMLLGSHSLREVVLSHVLQPTQNGRRTTGKLDQST